MNQKFNTVELTKMALLTALICVSAYIVIPLPFTPASLTAQTLVVNLIALLLTPRQAAFTMVVYILLGLSWIPAVMLMSWLKGKNYSFKRYCLVTILVGMPVIYLIGSAYMKFITGMDWAATFTAAVIPFIPLDIFKCFAAALIAKPVQISLSNAQRAR